MADEEVADGGLGEPKASAQEALLTQTRIPSLSEKSAEILAVRSQFAKKRVVENGCRSHAQAAIDKNFRACATPYELVDDRRGRHSMTSSTAWGCALCAKSALRGVGADLFTLNALNALNAQA